MCVCYAGNVGGNETSLAPPGGQSSRNALWPQEVALFFFTIFFYEGKTSAILSSHFLLVKSAGERGGGGSQRHQAAVLLIFEISRLRQWRRRVDQVGDFFFSK